MHRSKVKYYSIASSALPRSVGGTVILSALAVLRLMTSSSAAAIPSRPQRETHPRVCN